MQPFNQLDEAWFDVLVGVRGQSDLDKLAGKVVVVREVNAGEPFDKGVEGKRDVEEELALFSCAAATQDTRTLDHRDPVVEDERADMLEIARRNEHLQVLVSRAHGRGAK